MSDLAKQYARAVKALGDAEKAFQAALDAVQQARDSERWDSVPTLRKRCTDREKALDDALAAAQLAHGNYWRGRQAAEIPNLQAAALALHRFTRIVRCVGDSPQMARGTFDGFEFKPEDADPTEDVPLDCPDSELAWDHRDVWRGPRY